MGERADGKPPDGPATPEAPKNVRAWVTRAEAVATLVLTCVFVAWVAVIVIQQRRAGRDVLFVPGAENPEKRLLDLNSATVPELRLLPAVGPVRAKNIVNWRAAHGPFHTLEEVRKAAGMSAKDLDGIRDMVMLGVAPPEPLPKSGYAEPDPE